LRIAEFKNKESGVSPSAGSGQASRVQKKNNQNQVPFQYWLLTTGFFDVEIFS
jgi:hypothetical protein